ncbi:MAG: membrane protein insertase YidC [Gemmatimonadetes bacterium]|nr:membrane protein insertase YidC [Gemmatimonadota bacterium]
MKSEMRFLLAIVLMLVVLVVTNQLFPPKKPVPGTAADTTAVAGQGTPGAAAASGAQTGAAPATGTRTGAAPASHPTTNVLGDSVAAAAAAAQVKETPVTVAGPLYKFTFSNVGARLLAADMLQYERLNHDQRDGVVDLVPKDAGGYLGHELVAGPDTVDLSKVPFQVEPADGLQVTKGGGPKTLKFRYALPNGRLTVELSYEFSPDSYVVHVRGKVSGVDHALMITNLGQGLPYTEADSASEARSMAYVWNHVQSGIHSTLLQKPALGVQAGPYLWAAFKSKFFVIGMLAGQGGESPPQEADYLGGLVVSKGTLPGRPDMAVTQAVHPDGSFGYRLFLGPQDYARLSSLGEDMQDVNPYGWRFIRPVMRPLVSVITAILVFLHNNLSMSYGWVLVLFGVLMRVVLWPLNQKAMRAQLKNMAVQPLLQEIQKKYKDDPQRLNKEMMRLHKEEGFNPLAGCLPLMLPYPVLIALFFVFEKSIQLRGAPFLWLTDLSAPDPIYVLPIFMALSTFAMQFVTMRSLPQQQSSQMKMMMWGMPLFMLFIFLKLASGLNLYYAVANIATIPQQIWIAKERKKVAVKSSAKSKEKE